MEEAASLTAIARASRGDALIMVATFLVTVAVDLVTAVVIGVAVAIVLALRSVAREARLHQVPLDESDHLAEEHDLLRDHIVAYRIDGPLFF
ncbi:sodium-independent anion transporter, partial [Nocardia cyriacigeorgica]|nr:sodium-independent anion transporter [Nocardia cyriacigeorgica]